MKALKKALSVLVSLLMIFTFALPAFADDAAPQAVATYSIKINNAAGTYKAYQVFKGDLNGNTLSNVVWGDGVTPFNFKGNATAASIAKLVGTYSDNSEELKTFAAAAATAVINGKETSTATANKGVAELTGLTAGYYVIKNFDVGATQAISSYILNVAQNVTIENKASVPSFEKKVKDINDTTDTDASAWQDSADYDIGDAVPFMLQGTVAQNYDAYKEYYFAFHDVAEKGLTFLPKTVTVYVDNVKISSGYDVKTDALTDGCTFEVVFNDLKKINSVHAGSVIRVEYSATLNADAVLGNQGNVNTAHLEFSNNPNEQQKGSTGKTPDDSVIVFTYQVVVNKVDGNKQPLTGAEFKLEKVLKDGTKKTVAVETNTEGTTFTFKGLDDGNYILTETETPARYNTIAPITFTVTAGHNIAWNGEVRTGVLTSLTTGNTASGNVTFTADFDKGSLTTNVVNQSGATLPGTGGIGTTIFYVIGGLLMAAAAVLLITKKRMNSDK